jgi:hypothetical protein
VVTAATQRENVSWFIGEVDNPAAGGQTSIPLAHVVTAATQWEHVSWFIGEVNDPAADGQTSIPLAPHGHGCNTEGTRQLVHW